MKKKTVDLNDRDLSQLIELVQGGVYNDKKLYTAMIIGGYIDFISTNYKIQRADLTCDVIKKLAPFVLSTELNTHC